MALARRLAVVMLAMLRDGTSYDPTLTKPKVPLQTEPTGAVLPDLSARVA